MIRLLYIEDDEGQRDELSAALTSRGFDVEAHADGQRAIDRLAQHTFDVVLSDYNMPRGLGGLEVLQGVQRQEPDLPVILLTAHGSISIGVEAMRRGAHHFVTKPIDIEELDANLRHAQRHAETQRRLRLSEATAARHAAELERLLKESASRQDQLQAIIDASPAAIALFHPDGTVASTNRRVDDLFPTAVCKCGDTAEQFFDSIRQGFADPNAFDALIQSLCDAPDTVTHYDPQVAFNRMLPTQHKPPRFISAAHLPVHDRQGQDLGKLWIFTDLTAIRAANERLRTIVELAPVPIILVRFESGEVIYANEPFGRMLGVPLEELPEASKTAEFIRRADRRRVKELLVDTGKVQDVELELTRADGTRFWVGLSAICAEVAGATAILGVCHDITETKRMLDDLAQAHQTLKETHTQLVQSEKMAALGMLVAGIAHEINTPVGAIRSMYETLERSIGRLRDCVERDCPEGFKNVPRLNRILKATEDATQVIGSGAERVTNIVRRLRSFARLDEAELKEVDLHEGLEDTLTIIHHEIKFRVEVVKDYGDLPRIPCYPGPLNQVFLNLLINANQAISDKGTITIRTSIRDGEVHIAFADSGEGMSPEIRERVFDPGFTTKGVGVGTGLGLSICYQIMQDHHGRIDVESTPGKGSTFTVVFPANLDERLGVSL